MVGREEGEGTEIASGIPPPSPSLGDGYPSSRGVDVGDSVLLLLDQLDATIFAQVRGSSISMSDSESERQVLQELQL